MTDSLLSYTKDLRAAGGLSVGELQRQTDD